jgi:hypothetical protein
VFVSNETNGTWGKAQELPGFGTLNTATAAAGAVTSMSCASAGNCAVGGVYSDSSGDSQAFVANETNGTWGTAREVPGTATLNAGKADQVNSVSCASAGNCAVGGVYTDSAGNLQAFVADEVNGAWGSAQEVPGTAAPGTTDWANLISLSCAAPETCTAAGYDLGNANEGHAFLAEETGGIWSPAEAVPGFATLNGSGTSMATSVSCPAADACTAVGQYNDASGHIQAFSADETGGTWGNAQEIPGTATLNTAGTAGASTVSCASAGNCAVGGSYTDSAGHLQAFVADETGGTWGNAQELPGIAALNVDGKAYVNSISCAAPGTCAAGGSYTDAKGNLEAYVAAETGGTWGTAQEMEPSDTKNTDGEINSVSCGAPGVCAAAGDYVNASGLEASVANESLNTSTSLSLSAPSATFGDEQGEQVSVTVTSSAGTPTGTVKVLSGTATVCTATLVSGSGTCNLGATSLPAGTAHLTASYSGDPSNRVSTSAAVTVTVAPQPVAIGAVGGDGALWVQAPQLGGGWHSLGGQISAPPAVAAPAPTGTTPAQPVFITTASNHQLYIRSLTAGWAAVGPAKASCIGQPAAVVTGTTLTVGCRGLNNALWENSATLPASGLPQFTHGWTTLGGTLTAGPAVAPVNGTPTFFAPQAGGRIYLRTLATGYQSTPWICIASPAAATSPTGQTTFACQGGNHALWEAVNTGTGWPGATSLGGTMIAGPALAALTTGTASLVEGTNKAVWERPAHASWVDLGGIVNNGLSAVALG